MSSLKPAPKMRPRGPMRPRPKTIHIDSGSVEMAEGLQASRGKKGSNTNLTGKPLQQNKVECNSDYVCSSNLFLWQVLYLFYFSINRYLICFVLCLTFFLVIRFYLFLFLCNSGIYTAPSTMKRDYFRGSQDSLADTGRMGSTLSYKGLFFFI